MDDEKTIDLGGEGLEGTNLLGRFFLQKRLGEGGYGAVYLGTQLSVKRPCAVKILSRTDDPKFLLRFEKEARATSKLTHPNTIIIYDFGNDKDTAFIAMEFLDGQSLNEKLGDAQTLSVAETLHIAHQIGRSLDDAHNHGLIHRDVKPHNIMVINRGNDPLFVKVIDFGLVKAIRGDEPIQATLTRLTQTGAVVGTPAFMSPEQVGGAELDGRTDQYSLAVLIYRCLTGRTPFTGKNPVDLAAKHLMDTPMPMRSYNPNLKVSLEFEAVIRRGLAKSAADRFESCVEFVNALLANSSFESIEDVSSEVTVKLGATAIAASIAANKLQKQHVTPPISETLLKTTEPAIGFADTVGMPTPSIPKEKTSPLNEELIIERSPTSVKNSNAIYFVLFLLIVLCVVLSIYLFFIK